MGVDRTSRPTLMSWCVTMRALSSFSINSRKPSRVSNSCPWSRSPSLLRSTLCTAYPLPAASDSSTPFTRAHTRRCWRAEDTQCPVLKRNKCCACSNGVTSFGRSSYRSPTPMGRSSGNALQSRPCARGSVGSSATPGHPTTPLPATVKPNRRASSSASRTSGAPSIVPELTPMPKCSATARNSSRMRSASSPSSSASSAPKLAPTRRRHHRARIATDRLASGSVTSPSVRQSSSTFS